MPATAQRRNPIRGARINSTLTKLSNNKSKNGGDLEEQLKNHLKTTVEENEALKSEIMELKMKIASLENEKRSLQRTYSSAPYKKLQLAEKLNGTLKNLYSELNAKEDLIKDKNAEITALKTINKKLGKDIQLIQKKEEERLQKLLDSCNNLLHELSQSEKNAKMPANGLFQKHLSSFVETLQENQSQLKSSFGTLDRGVVEVTRRRLSSWKKCTGNETVDSLNDVQSQNDTGDINDYVKSVYNTSSSTLPSSQVYGNDHDLNVSSGVITTPRRRRYGSKSVSSHRKRALSTSSQKSNFYGLPMGHYSPKHSEPEMLRDSSGSEDNTNCGRFKKKRNTMLSALFN